MIRVMIVDDHSVVRLGLQMRLLLEKDIESVGEASTGEEALTLIQDASPDVVLMDVELPGMDGVETARVLRMVAPQSVIVILTIHDDLSTRTRAQAAGVAAFVGKRGRTEDLLSVIRQVVRHTE